MGERSESLKMMYEYLEQRYQEQRHDMTEGKQIVKLRLGVMSIILGVLSFIASNITRVPEIAAMKVSGILIFVSLLPMFIAFIVMFWYAAKLLDDEIAVPLFTLTTNLKIVGLQQITTPYIFQTLTRHLAKTIAVNERFFTVQSKNILWMRRWNLFMIISSIIPFVTGMILYIL